MNRIGNGLHVAFEQAASIGVGDHHRRHVRAKARSQRSKVDAPFSSCRDRFDLEAAACRRGRVGAMRAFGHEDHATVGFTARPQRRGNCQQAAQFAMGTGFGAHRHTGHAGQLLEPFAQFMNDGKRTLHALFRLQRMGVGKAGHPRHLLIEAGIMLHRARAQREQAKVDGIILTRQAGIMAHRFGFAQAGQRNRRTAGHTAEAVQTIGQRRDVDAGLLNAALFEDQRFFQHQRTVAGIGSDRASGFERDRSGRTAFLHHAHASSSCSARASVAISAAVVVSVIATSRPLASSALSG